MTVFQKDVTVWSQLRRFCSWLDIIPDLQGIKYPTSLLQIFVKRVQTGLLSVNGKPINKQSINKYLRSTNQNFASVEADDPRHNHMGEIDFRLVQKLASYQK